MPDKKGSDDRAYARGFAAGRAAATPDPPTCRCPDDWRYDDGSVFCPRHSTKPDAPAPASPDPPNEDAIRADERERLSARVYENGWCPTCATTPAASPDPPDEDAVTAVVRVLNRTMDLTARERAAAVLAVAAAASPDPADVARVGPNATGANAPAPAASPDERLREAVAALPQYVITIQDREGYTYERGCEGQPMNYTGVMLADVEALVGKLKDGATTARETTNELKDAAADREKPEGCRAPHCFSEYGTPCGTCPALAASADKGWSPGIDDPEPPALGDIDTGEGWYQT